MQQKLKSSTFENLINADLTSAELNFILYLTHFQTDSGRIVGVYYKDICEAIKISYQTFYDVMRSLQQKKIISCEKRNYDDWDITILNNSFAYEGAVNEGYISMAAGIFNDSDFYALKVQEKLLAIHIIRASGAGKRRYCINVKNFYDKFCAILKVSKRVIRGYLKRLRRFLSIGIKDDNIWVTLLKKTKEHVNTDKETFTRHAVQVIWRRNRVKEDKAACQELKKLLGQYAGELKDQVSEYIMAATKQSLELRNQKIKNTYKWNRKIDIRYVHYLLREELSQNGQTV